MICLPSPPRGAPTDAARHRPPAPTPAYCTHCRCSCRTRACRGRWRRTATRSTKRRCARGCASGCGGTSCAGCRPQTLQPRPPVAPSPLSPFPPLRALEVASSRRGGRASPPPPPHTHAQDAAWRGARAGGGVVLRPGRPLRSAARGAAAAAARRRPHARRLVPLHVVAPRAAARHRDAAPPTTTGPAPGSIACRYGTRRRAARHGRRAQAARRGARPARPPAGSHSAVCAAMAIGSHEHEYSRLPALMDSTHASTGDGRRRGELPAARLQAAQGRVGRAQQVHLHLAHAGVAGGRLPLRAHRARAAGGCGLAEPLGGQ